MHYRELGKTGLEVSAIGFGALGIGSSFYGQKDRGESLRSIERALDLGVNLFDTCPSYGNSEEILGEAFKGRRDRVIISTKIRGSNLDSIPTSVEHSLGRLRTDFIDVLQLRDPTPQRVDAYEVLENMDALKRQGKIRFGSVTIGDNRLTEQGLYSIEKGFDTIQLAYNMVFRDAAESVLPQARAAGVGILGRGPLCKGFLTSRICSIPDEKRAEGSFSQFTIAEAETLIEIQRGLEFLIIPGERTLAQAAVQFALRQDAISAIIPSMDQVIEVDELVGALQAPQITEEEIDTIAAVIEGHGKIEY